MHRGKRTSLLVFFAVRRFAMIGVAAGSVGAGAALLWLWFTPERIGGVETLPLVALLGLFVLPVVAALLIRHERRTRPAPQPERTLDHFHADRNPAPRAAA